jgi:hypothetical protein
VPGGTNVGLIRGHLAIPAAGRAPFLQVGGR